jgi:hypothetical protein
MNEIRNVTVNSSRRENACDSRGSDCASTQRLEISRVHSFSSRINGWSVFILVFLPVQQLSLPRCAARWLGNQAQHFHKDSGWNIQHARYTSVAACESMSHVSRMIVREVLCVDNKWHLIYSCFFKQIKILFRKKLRADWSQGMHVVIPCRTFCLPVWSPNI